MKLFGWRIDLVLLAFALGLVVALGGQQAYLWWQVEAPLVAKLTELDGVDEVYSCAGDVDLIAILRVSKHEDLADIVPGRINKVEGVLDTDTHIAFRSYSRRDTEAAFSIGLDEQ